MRQTLLLVAGLAAFVIASKILVENVLGIRLEPMVAAWLAAPGAGSALAIVAVLAADVLLPVPSSVVMILSGAAFGVVYGSALALLGSVLGEWLGFELARRYGLALASRMAGATDLAHVNRFFDRHGALAVMVTRPIPVVMETMSLVAGLSGMRRVTFLLASLIGTLPIVVLYAYAGAMSRQVGNLLPAVIILIAVAGGGWLLYRANVTPNREPSS